MALNGPTVVRTFPSLSQRASFFVVGAASVCTSVWRTVLGDTRGAFNPLFNWGTGKERVGLPHVPQQLHWQQAKASNRCLFSLLECK